MERTKIVLVEVILRSIPESKRLINPKETSNSMPFESGLRTEFLRQTRCMPEWSCKLVADNEVGWAKKRKNETS